MHRNRFLIVSIICFAIALLCALALSGATYYVDTASTHGGDGTTQATAGANRAWDTIADVNAASFNPGDSILFKRGCTWREQLTVPSPGSVGLPITFGAYGTGDDPIIMNSEAKNSTGDWTNDSGGTTVTANPAASGDDVAIKPGTSEADITKTYIAAGKYSTTVLGGGVRFIGVNVPKDATITAASVAFKPCQSDTGATCNIAIDGEDDAHPAIFSTYANYTGRARTTATVAWNAVPSWTENTSYNSADVKDIISEIVQLADWVSGHNLVLFFSDNVSSNGAEREGHSYDSGDTSPTLSVTYSSSSNIWYTHITNHVDVGHIATTSASTPTILGDKKNTKAGCINAGDFFFDHDTHNLYVYCTQNPATEYSGYIECAYGEVAGYQSAISINTIDYITIDGIEVKHCGAHGIQLVTTTGITVQNCKVSYCGGSYLSGTLRYGNGIESWGAIATATIQHNDISYCFDEGITLQDSATQSNINKTNVTIHGNVVDYCGRGFSYSQDATGTCATSNLTISGNTFSNNGLGWSGIGNGDGEGMLLSRSNGTMATTVISGNIIDTCIGGGGNNGFGIELLGIAADILRNKITGCNNNVVRFINSGANQCSGTFAYNLVYGNAATAHSIFIYGNTGVLNIYNNVLSKETAGTGCLIRIDGNSSGPVIKNNIIECTATNDTQDLIALMSGSTATSDYNLWWKPDDQAIWWWIDTDYTKSQFSTYKAAKSQDEHSPTPTDPLFVTAGSNFHLQSTSPCINAGVDVDLTEDFEGNSIIRLPDIGAYEYQEEEEDTLILPAIKKAIKKTTKSVIKR